VPLKYNPFADLPWPEFSAVGASLALSCAWPAVRLAVFPARQPAERADDVTLSARTVQP
jgi:hypothetical protein